jgi:hypothetical protein
MREMSAEPPWKLSTMVKSHSGRSKSSGVEARAAHHRFQLGLAALAGQHRAMQVVADVEGFVVLPPRARGVLHRLLAKRR